MTFKLNTSNDYANTNHKKPAPVVNITLSSTGITSFAYRNITVAHSRHMHKNGSICLGKGNVGIERK